jgi:hypothetical protein
MSVKFALSVLDCHWIVPVLSLTVKVVLFAPEQTVAAPLRVPATDTGFTVATTAVLAVDLQPVVEFLDSA